MKKGITSIEIAMIVMLVIIIGGVLVVGLTETKEYNRLLKECMKVKPEFECVGLLKPRTGVN